MPDRLSWAEVRRLALQHKKALIWANLVAVLATLCSVPIPLLLPLLVDEVLLNDGDAALKVMDNFLPANWETAAGYIGLMLVLTFFLRGGALIFNVLQARLFARLSKDIVYRIRIRLIERLKRISLGEYESLGGGTVTTHLVTDLDANTTAVTERHTLGEVSEDCDVAVCSWCRWHVLNERDRNTKQRRLSAVCVLDVHDCVATESDKLIGDTVVEDALVHVPARIRRVWLKLSNHRLPVRKCQT